MKCAAGLLGLVLVLAQGMSNDRVPSFKEPRTGMEFVSIPAGVFTMGSPLTEKDREVQESRHTVTLSHGFELGRLEVTQGQWRRVMGANPSHFVIRGDDFPVENVNYSDIEEFLKRLNAGTSTRRFRLPTEAEWEYACRAGAATAFATGDELTPDQANFLMTATSLGRGTMKVGSFAPNAWGLFDMHGNVWEWTADDHCPYPDRPATDPEARCGSGLKVIRGGSWYFGTDSARCALRYTHPPKALGPSLGFRVAADRR